MRSILMRPISGVYANVMNIRNWLYDSKIWKAEEVGVPVVSVGNVTLGGTGKTPVICELLRWAVENKLNPAVVSRGYKGNFKGIAHVDPEGDPKLFGDEPTMIAKRFPTVPVYVGTNRVLAAQKLIQEQPQVRIIFADDAFQHRRLAREIDIVVVDCSEPIENYAVMPAGRGREVVRSIRRADCIILNKVNLASPEQKTRVIDLLDTVLDGRDTPVIESEYYIRRLVSFDHKTTVEPTEFEPVTLVSAIGNPAAFETLVAKNFDVKRHFKFRDHHAYSKHEVEKIEAESRSLRIKRILTTEKDAVKIRPLIGQDTQFWQADLQPKLSLRVKWLYEKILDCVH